MAERTIEDKQADQLRYRLQEYRRARRFLEETKEQAGENLINASYDLALIQKEIGKGNGMSTPGILARIDDALKDEGVPGRYEVLMESVTREQAKKQIDELALKSAKLLYQQIREFHDPSKFETVDGTVHVMYDCLARGGKKDDLCFVTGEKTPEAAQAALEAAKQQGYRKQAIDAHKLIVDYGHGTRALQCLVEALEKTGMSIQELNPDLLPAEYVRS